jgi:hypothetical protein
MSSLWPYVVNTAISLDGGAPVLFDLQDYTQPNAGGGPPTAKSRIVAKADGLENTQHTVRVSVGAAQHYAIMDMLMCEYLYLYLCLSSSNGSRTDTLR